MLFTMKNSQSSKATVAALIVLLAVGIALYAYHKNDLGADVEVHEDMVIEAPQPNVLVKLPVTIKGHVNKGGGWIVNEGEVGSAQVFDSNGKAISSVEVIRATTNWLESPVYFEGHVGDREMMSYITTETGVIRMSSQGAKDGERIQAIEIPIRFK